MNVHDYKLLLTNEEKYDATVAGLSHNDKTIWNDNGYAEKMDCGSFCVVIRKDLRPREWKTYSYRSLFSAITILKEYR